MLLNCWRQAMWSVPCVEILSTSGRLSMPQNDRAHRTRPGTRSEQDHAPYSAWQKLGFITPIGPTTDPRAVAYKIAELNGQNKIMSLALDRWRINDLKRELDAIGCHVPLEPHGQGYKEMSPAVDIVYVPGSPPATKTWPGRRAASREPPAAARCSRRRAW